ncbi:hypothetical protein [Halobaculum roseum]|uniref:Uncharacterized protein n=1 Tax=Halobaculum roseum TaxID=2175149 RepID=A0ABD5MMU3_9EURY|nr:hypothetical protein [Halobaculum roseum]QZY03829.1 hypothetical protein K6T36_06620 [Halobaculum roseum]
MASDPSPTRRSLLAGLAALAGCTSSHGSDGDQPTVNPALEGSPTASPTRTSRPSPTESPTAGPTATAAPPGSSRFDDRPCPPVLDACFHRSDSETPVFVRPSAERVAPGDELTMSLVNRHDEAVFIGPYYWTVWRERDAGGWLNVDDREVIPDLGAAVPPGGTYDWRVPVDADTDGGTGVDIAASNVPFASGVYCFGHRSDVPLSAGSDDQGRVGALFEVE